MFRKLPVAATLAAFAAILSLSACGGGGGGGDASPGPAVSSPAALVKTDTAPGTGVEAVAGKTVTVKYTGWLYSASAADFKGMQFDSGTLSPFVLGTGKVIPGWDQGLPGMKVGGKRTLLIPASLAYGSNGAGQIPPNSGLVFDVELLAVQ